MYAENNALAQLDNGRGGAEDRDMSLEMESLRQEMGAGFKEVNARIDVLRHETATWIDETRREVTARIDDLRKETADNFKAVDAKTEQVRQETAVRIEQVWQETADNFKVVDSKIEQVRQETAVRIEQV